MAQYDWLMFKNVTNEDDIDEANSSNFGQIQLNKISVAFSKDLLAKYLPKQ